MNISIQNYTNSSHINFNAKDNYKNIKEILPAISLYNTGIKDVRLLSLIVERRERMLQEFSLPPEYIYVDEYGMNRVKPHLFIKEIIVKPEFLRKGICRKIENTIVELSKKEGYEGRVLLFSSPINGKNSYISNPTLAHWANGFRFYSSNHVKQMLEVLNGTRLPENAPNGLMYYPII